MDNSSVTVLPVFRRICSRLTFETPFIAPLEKLADCRLPVFF